MLKEQAPIEQLFKRTAQREDGSGYYRPEIAARQVAINQSVWEFFRKHTSHNGSFSILDVCCGAAGLAGIVNNDYYTGIDIAVHSLKENPQSVAAANALHLPFAEQQFEAVFTIMAIHSLYDLAAAAEEMARVIKPGGHLVIAENGLSMWNISLMLYCLNEVGVLSLTKKLLDPKQRKDSASFLGKAGLSPRQYLKIVPPLLGKSVQDLANLIETHNGNDWSLFAKIQELYFQNLDHALQIADFVPEIIDKMDIFKYDTVYQTSPLEELPVASFADAYQNNDAKAVLRGAKRATGRGPQSYFPVFVGIFTKF